MTPMFSVLLPTRNGGPFIDDCIRSVLDQADDRVELIVSDNANTDETPAVLARYRDHPRVRLLRLDEPVSVTDNWNNALSASEGEYVLMMGDDDLLLPGYFDFMRGLFERYGKPDCVLYNGYSYVAPGSMGEHRHSYFSDWHFRYDAALQSEMVMPMALCRAIVRDMFRFRVGIPLNMQTTLVRREAGARIPGGMFQAPFPDHFALNSLLLLGARWVFSPERLVVVGVSPKSFGHYVYSNQQGSGLAYLGIDATFPGRLPGNELLNGMHIWLNRLSVAFPAELDGVSIDRGGYARRQFYAWLLQSRLGTLPRRELLARLRLLSIRDWGGLAACVLDAESWRRLARMVTGGGRSGAEKQWHALRPLEGVSSIREFAARIAAGEAM